MPNLPPIKISHELILAVAVILVGLVALADLIMTLSVSSSTQNAIVFLYNLVQNQTNDTFQLEVNGHLAYLQQSILGVSQSYNTTRQADLQAINTLKESSANLKNRLDVEESRVLVAERKLGNQTAYIDNLNLTCTNTTTVIYQNSTTQIPVQGSCRNYLIDKYHLGPYFDVVSCCELRQVGYADECCACYR